MKYIIAVLASALAIVLAFFQRERSNRQDAETDALNVKVGAKEEVYQSKTAEIAAQREELAKKLAAIDAEAAERVPPLTPEEAEEYWNKK